MYREELVDMIKFKISTGYMRGNHPIGDAHLLMSGKSRLKGLHGLYGIQIVL
jgi:hypothetical protein